MTGPVAACQSCGSYKLDKVLSLGHLPACNSFHSIEAEPIPEQFYPHDLVKCRECALVQLGYLPHQELMFPSDYPYTSSTTRALRENFADLAVEVSALHPMATEDLVIDIGGNDGNLLSNFVGKQRVLNVTPEDIGQLGEERGIPHWQAYWDGATADAIVAKHGQAKLITATNVFAHVPDPNGFVEAVLSALSSDGVFVSESHYLGAVISDNQWDTIYGEHARYYSLESLRNLLSRHGLTIAFCRDINSHGGSIRVYACRPDYAPKIAERVNSDARFRARMRTEDAIDESAFPKFASRVAESKRNLWRLLSSIKETGARIYGIGAPSRASTLINYVGIDHNMLDCIVETPGSYKLGKMMPGTLIPVVEEHKLYDEQPEFAMLLSWHIGLELMPKLRAKGYAGKFVMPLPDAKVIS